MPLSAFFLFIFFESFSFQQLKLLVTRESIKDSYYIRYKYDEMCRTVEEKIPSGSRIWMIEQESNSYGYYICKYNLLDYKLSSKPSVGIPFYDDDIFTLLINVDDWKTSLAKEWDYVVLMETNKYFVDNFAEAFNDPTAIKNGNLFRVDHSNGMLVTIP